MTGFSTAEIDRLLDVKIGEGSSDGVPQARAVTRPGELWLLGHHKALCGDARHAESYIRLLGNERAQMVFCDAPYNVETEGNVSGLGKARHREFAMASGEMNEGEFTAFLETVMRLLVVHSDDGSIHYQCMDWRHMREMLDAGHAAYSELKNLCAWAKENAGMGSFYRSQHELVFVWKNGRASHINNFGLGEGGRWRSNVWTYPGANSFHQNRDDELAMHSTVKNVSMVADAIRDCSKRGGIIFDPLARTSFSRSGGSGYAGRMIV